LGFFAVAVFGQVLHGFVSNATLKPVMSSARGPEAREI
jgi:hypothetical protein